MVALDPPAPADGWSAGERPPLRWRFDLRPGRPDPSSFPRRPWMRALRQALASAPDDALGYGSPVGELSLRAELASYLNRARGLRVGPEHLLISAGFTQALGLVCRALAVTGQPRRIAMEEPSVPDHREIVRRHGQEPVLLRVDGEGADVEQLEAAGKVAAVVLTPNRQHPTGVVLSARRRGRLLEWARATNAYIVEDDYGGEFHYDDRPIGPLQGLAPERVVYAGTASQALAPGIRLGWLAVPDSLRGAVAREKQLSDWHTNMLAQLAFAELLRSAGYDRHIRRMRRVYRRRRDVLVRAIADARLDVNLLSTAAGLNLLIPLPDPASETRALEATRAAGVGVGGLIDGGYYEREPAPGLIVGFASAPEHSFGSAVDALIEALVEALGRT